MEALGRAGRRVVYHLLQAIVEGLKAVEAVIEEVGNLSAGSDDDSGSEITRIEIE
jgi:hypothetical protein